MSGGQDPNTWDYDVHSGGSDGEGVICTEDFSGGPPVFIPPDTVVHDVVYAQAPTLWHLNPAQWNAVWERATGAGIRVAILDTGYSKHEAGPVPIHSRSFIQGQSIADGNGHGTHCAGTALGRKSSDGTPIGVAPGADLIVGKVLSNGGSGGSNGIAAGIRWATEVGADVISMSLGGGGPDSATNAAIADAISKGVVVNAAAGNSGYNGGNTIGWPAKGKDCICCAAYQKSGLIANFSSGGSEIDWACPGQDIVSFSTNGSGYRSMSGTSMATPFGSGVLALLIELMRRQGNAQWSAADAVRAFFKANMTDAGAPGFDARFGMGIPVVWEILGRLVRDDLEFA